MSLKHSKAIISHVYLAKLLKENPNNPEKVIEFINANKIKIPDNQMKVLLEQKEKKNKK